MNLTLILRCDSGQVHRVKLSSSFNYLKGLDLDSNSGLCGYILRPFMVETQTPQGQGSVQDRPAVVETAKSVLNALAVNLERLDGLLRTGLIVKRKLAAGFFGESVFYS